jgi:hypothetical protein
VSALGRARELAALVDEFAPTAWRRDPAWWALLGTAALTEPWGQGATAYLASDADPGTDTFMAAPTAVPRDASDWIAWAVASAHAARDAVARLDGTLPDQPLAVTIARAGGIARTAPLAQPAGSASRSARGSGAASSTAAARRTTPTWRARWRARCAASRRS